MNFSEIKYRNGPKYFNIENWMTFAAQLGSILRKRSLTEKFNIYLSLPNSLIFSKFLIMGIFDQKLKEKVTEAELFGFFKSLKYGDVIYYLEDDVWKKCSVIEVTQGFSSKDSLHLKILNHKNMTHYIPSNQWEKRVIISSASSDMVVGARVIQEFKHLSQSNLKYIYPSTVLNIHQLINEPCIFIAGNKSEFNRNIDTIELVIERHGFTFKDFIYEGKDRQFQNIKWLSKDAVIDFEGNSAPITLFMGANKALSDMQKYNQISTRIILDDRHENTETSELLRLSIEQEIFQKKSIILSQEIYKELLDSNISIPRGVEFIAWK